MRRAALVVLDFLLFWGLTFAAMSLVTALMAALTRLAEEVILWANP